jgi:hypothetical protein
MKVGVVVMLDLGCKETTNAHGDWVRVRARAKESVKGEY